MVGSASGKPSATSRAASERIASVATSSIRRGLSGGRQAADDEPDRLRGRGSSPRPRAPPSSSSRDDRTEHAHRADGRPAFTNENWSTITQSHVRDAELSPAVGSSRRKCVRLDRRLAGIRISAMKTAPSEVRAGVDGDRPARAERRHEEAAGAAPPIMRRVHRQPEQRVRLLEQAARHGLGNDAGRGGEEERGSDPVRTPASAARCQISAFPRSGAGAAARLCERR